MSYLSDKVALITGSSRGIGAAVALLFARRGAKVAVHGRDKAALSGVRADIERDGGRAVDVVADVTKFADIEEMRLTIERELGPVDILVANAGGASPCRARSKRSARRGGARPSRATLPRRS